MKKSFEIPILEIIRFTTEDIMTVSSEFLREDELGIYKLK